VTRRPGPVAAILVAVLALHACATSTPPPETTPDIVDARGATPVAGPSISDLPITSAQAVRALAAFRVSCPVLVERTDASRLTSGADWKPICAVAATWPDADAAAFFAEHFETIRVGDGRAFATGYYEPEIAGARNRQAGYDTPVYKRPPDLVEGDLGAFADDLKGRTVRGRVEDSRLVPYHDRAAIEDGALAGRNLEIGWAADPVELFFLHIQGSGRLRLPDGGVMRIGYDEQNGRGYTAIGAVLRERGVFRPGEASMAGIMAWLRANPAEGKALMRENRSYIFFRELTGPGPIGALGVPVAAEVSVAADPRFVPLGAPVWLAMDGGQGSRLWVAQDTGGAIKGANRFDTFWGAGEQARATAGALSARGTALLLLPKGSLARLNMDRGDGQTSARR
jgi:membrane-bound lytic murein transglycosylase A